MISGHTFLAFSGLALLLIVLPGPSMLFIVGRALNHGRREALLSVVGNALGVFVHAGLVAVGVGALLASSEAAFWVLKIGGGLYLIYLGVQQIRHRHDGADALVVLSHGAGEAGGAGEAAGTGGAHARAAGVGAAKAKVVAARPGAPRLLLESFAVGITNPKTLVFMVAVLPQFADPARGSMTWQMLELGAIFLVIALISDSTIALVATWTRRWFLRSPRRLASIRSAGGAMIAGLGVVLLASRRAV